MFAAFQLGSAGGAYAMGAYYDKAGNYIGALWAIAGLVALGTLLIALLGKYPDLEAKATV
jgi:predicted MFS family arabinose efflux permease